MASKSKTTGSAENQEMGLDVYFDELDTDEVSSVLETAGYAKLSNDGAYRKNAVRYEDDEIFQD